MSTKRQQTTFSSPLLLAKDKGFLFAKIPPELSKAHLRLGRITARISIGSSHFDAQMEPDGKLGHWFIIPSSVAKKKRSLLKSVHHLFLAALKNSLSHCLQQTSKRF